MQKVCCMAACTVLLFFGAAPAFTQSLGRTVNGELALRAIQRCFPGKTGAVAFIDNDWTISAGGEIFFWAEGRLLPSAEKDNIDSYSPHFFYTIPQKPAEPDSYPPQYIEALRRRSETRAAAKDNHRGLQSILYGGPERRDIEALLVQVDFLGAQISVHQIIVPALKRVEAEIQRWDGAKTFIDSIKSIGGYSWREIAGTQRMSYHSWGLAVDIQPKNIGTKAIYWLWEMGRNKDWMLVPLENRWNPPAPVIEAFEKEGFVWGGKWPVYDNMHFEYRPELHEYTRLLAANPNAAVSTPGYGQNLHHIFPDFLLKLE